MSKKTFTLLIDNIRQTLVKCNPNLEEIEKATNFLISIVEKIDYTVDKDQFTLLQVESAKQVYSQTGDLETDGITCSSDDTTVVFSIDEDPTYGDRLFVTSGGCKSRIDFPDDMEENVEKWKSFIDSFCFSGSSHVCRRENHSSIDVIDLCRRNDITCLDEFYKVVESHLDQDVDPYDSDSDQVDIYEQCGKYDWITNFCIFY